MPRTLASPAATTLFTLALLAAAALPAAAHQDPPTCTIKTYTVVVDVLRGDKETPVVGSVSECEPIYYVATVRKSSTNDDRFCAFSGGSFTLITPDGTGHTISENVPCTGGKNDPCSAQSFVSDAIDYTVRPEDVENGFVTAFARYSDGTAHSGTTHTEIDTLQTPKSTPVVFCTDGAICTVDDCDPSEFGADACSSTTAPSTTPCRPAAGVCDLAEFCTGTSTTCPANTFRTPASVCRPSAGACDPFETCEGGSNPACPADKLSSSLHVCRAAVSVCDISETCTGTNVLCPTNVFAEQTVCRPQSGVCDVAEQCTGTSDTCPSDAVLPTTTVCRSSFGVCDVVERCTGSSKTCPANAVATTATTCRAAASICDAAEACTGSTTSCPSDGLAGSTTVCRAAAGSCDVAESCTGASSVCPANAFATTATTCRAASGVCDVAELCTGSSATCPANAVLSTSTVCRAASGVCDVAERCTGSSSTCPGDAVSPTTTVCRSSFGVCDVAERCTGNGKACPANAVATTATTCRAAATVCDAAEACTGSATTCPADGFRDFGTPCTSDGEPCTDDVCSGGAADCTHPPNSASCNDGLFCNGNDTCAGGTCSAHDGNPCPLPDSDGDCTEACNEATDDCTAPDPNDTNCDHPDPCVQGETCKAGECVGTLVPSCSTTTTTLPGPLCGDASQDGDISAPDALLALRTAVGTADCPASICDYNGSGEVQTSDALQILRVAVGQEIPPECPPPMSPPAPSTSTTTTTTTPS
jgi:hypothetical protein